MRQFSTLLLLALTAVPFIIFIPQTAGGGPVPLIETMWAGSGAERGQGVVVDSSGNIYVTGYTDSFGAGDVDVLLLKYNPMGELQWQRTWGGSDYDAGFGVGVDSSGNMYVTGATESFGAGHNDVLLFLLKLSPTGNLQWQLTWGSGAYGDGVAVGSSDSIYVTGHSASFGAFLLKFDSSGSLLWQRAWEGSSGLRGQSVAVDSSDNIYVAGSICPFGSCHDVHVLKFDSTGSVLWQKTWDARDNEQGLGITVDSSGNIYVTGCMGCFAYEGGDDVFLLSYDSSGGLRWQRTWGKDGADRGYAVVADSSGNIYVTGTTTSFGSGFLVLFLKFDSSGTLQWQSTWSGGDGWDLAVDSSDNVHVVGGSSTRVPFPFISVSGTLGTPTFPTADAGGATSEPMFPIQTPSVALGIPSGSRSFVSSTDVFVLKLRPVSITVPSVPRSLYAWTPQNQTKITLVWVSPESDGGAVITEYRIYRRDSSGESSLLDSIEPTCCGYSYTDNSVTAGLTHHYRVTAVNAVGEGVSSEVSAMPSHVAFQIAFSVNPIGSGDISCIPTLYIGIDSAGIAANSTSTCYAYPRPGHRFSSWSGVASGDSNPVTFRVTGPGQLRATFVPSPPLIFGLPALPFYGLLGGLIVVVAVLTPLFYQRRRRRVI